MTSTKPPFIAIEAGVDHLAAVRAFVRQQAAAAGADDETTADLVQAVDELVCNVVEHGYAGRPGRIEVASLQTADDLAFRIRDDAPTFDPRTVPEPPLDLPLAQRRLGGMGVHLARDLTDGFDHRILPTGGNEVTVRKRLRIATEGTDDGHHD
ncbi:MAG: ATP-binding protein, partial [Chloroflexota bacterium]|nr:ATP-binding protein [Chloroflexota bacterium]